MKTIWKFTLKIDDEQMIEMPQGARLLSVDDQHGGLQIWAIVDDQAPRVHREIVIRGTGHPIRWAEDLPFVGSVQQMGGRLVWHVFDGGEQ